MKQLLAILLGATVVFMALAMIQEWEVFAPALLPSAEETPTDEPTPAAVFETVDHFNTILVHLYRFGGDERFLARLPASPAVQADIRRDLVYLARNGISQSMTRIGFEVLSERRLRPDVWQIEAEEEWTLEYRDGGGATVSDRPMSWVVTWRYVVQETDSGWIVAAMGPAGGA